MIYLNLALGVLTMLFWFKSQFTNPGYISKPKEMDFLVSSG